ncbi:MULTISPECIES: hypothetical protein [Anaeromyxobacter]|uniref:hypothetical protein n=1 Tax=Anaeromyxobacter TaxID=161492 RepID=UPI001F56B484|nr:MULTISPECIES: hypothetical protein [unclassified Anaeromyxobacter]
MRTHLSIALGLALAAAGCRTAQGTRASSGNAGRTVEGRVEEVGRDDGTVTLRVGDKRREVLVAPEAEIKVDDFKATFEDLKEGQRVRAALDESKGQTEGYRIEILDKGATAPTDVEKPAPTEVEKPAARSADAPSAEPEGERNAQ